MAKKVSAKKKAAPKKAPKKSPKKQAAALRLATVPLPAPMPEVHSPAVLDRLWGVVSSRRGGDPTVSHSARLLARGTDKVAQKFGEEAVECLIEAVAGNRAALINESADVLYHLIVMWVNAGVRAEEVWAELERREGVSGIAEKAARAAARLPMRFGVRTRKIP